VILEVKAESPGPGALAWNLKALRDAEAVVLGLRKAGAFVTARRIVVVAGPEAALILGGGLTDGGRAAVLQIAREPLPPMTSEMKAIIEEMK